jgi:hypothetical protein
MMNNPFAEGHGFSHAVKDHNVNGFSPGPFVIPQCLFQHPLYSDIRKIPRRLIRTADQYRETPISSFTS